MNIHHCLVGGKTKISKTLHVSDYVYLELESKFIIRGPKTS